MDKVCNHFIDFIEKRMHCLKKRNVFFFIVLQLFLINYSFARQGLDSTYTNYKFFGTKEGFYAEKVKEIVQDSLGFLWLATSNGLYQYDGYSFSTFDATIYKSELLETSILCIYKDKKNDLWIGTNKGLLFYNHLTGRFKQISLLNKSDYVTSISQDENATIWIGTDNGVFTIDTKHEVSYLSRIGSLHCPIVLVSKSITTKVFLVAKNDILVLDNTSYKILDTISYTGESALADNPPTAAIIDPDNQMWIGKYNGDVIRFHLSTKKSEVYNLKKTTNNPAAKVNHLLFKNDKLWLSIDEGGTICFDYKTNRFIDFETSNQNHLPSYKVSAFFIDQENNYWLGMEKNGLGMTNSYINNFHFIGDALFGKNKIISSLLKDSEGHVWAGTDGGGMYLFNAQHNLIHKFKSTPGLRNGLSDDAVLAMYQDSKKRIWIGTYRGGLSLYNTSGKTFKHYQENKSYSKGLLSNNVRGIKEDVYGNLWLVVHGKGVSCFNPESETFVHFTDSIGLWTNDLCITREGAIWVAASTGIFRKLPGQDTFHPVVMSKNGLPETYVNCLFEDNRQQMWIGTLHGLYRYEAKNQQFIKLKLSPLLSNASIESINQDISGKYFIATNIGLFRYDQKRQSVDHFGVADGLHSADFINNAYSQNDSTLYLGSSNGFCWFNPSSIGSIKTTVSICLKDIKIFNTSIQFNPHHKIDKSMPFIDQLVVAHNENFITFCFAFPSYVSSASQLIFEYKLDGFDKDWQQGNSQMFASYTSIPPGDYRLRVRMVKNNFYVTGGKELTFKLIIHPPFYETWWFRLLVIASVLFSIAWYFKQKTRQLANMNKLLEIKIRERTFEISQQNEKLEEQRKELELANTTKDKLFSIIAHDLRSPFTAILSMSNYLTEHIPDKGSDKIKEITKGISNASKNAYQVLENLLQWAQSQTGRLAFRQSWVQVNQVVQSIVEASGLQCLDKNISLNFKYSQLLEAHIDSTMFETIVRNLVHNAIKYTLPNGTITIQLSESINGFIFSIEDNGIGMDADTVDRILHQKVLSSERGTIGEAGTGLGLTIVKEFIQHHQSEWTIVSEKNKGTCIRIQFQCAVKAQENVEHSIEKEGVETLITDNSSENAPDILNPQMLLFLKDKQLLMVDDQEEIRQAIALQLEGKIIIHQAANGKEGLTLARDLMPDIILSDVVMPEMNGIDFSVNIKSDILTSHIPVILLTSQQEEKDVIAGLKSGVDDYLLKPFNGSILLLKIFNLLLNRERVKKKFSLDDKVLLDSLEDNSLDKKFLLKIQTLIQENIDNEEYSVEKLSADIGMHRSNLSKKISALTGMSPNELIKSHRMKLAARLLLSSGKNISEVAYEVGFSDPKYFSKVFKTHFGHLPSDYVQLHKSQN